MPAKKLSLQVNWLSRNGEVSIRGLVVSALGFQIGDALVVVHLPEISHVVSTSIFMRTPREDG